MNAAVYPLSFASHGDPSGAASTAPKHWFCPYCLKPFVVNRFLKSWHQNLSHF